MTGAATMEVEAHRSHYAAMEIDTIDLMLANASPAEAIGFLRWNAIKYLMRAGTKGGDRGEMEDYDKAVVYTTWLQEYVTTWQNDGRGRITSYRSKEAKK